MGPLVINIIFVHGWHSHDVLVYVVFLCVRYHRSKIKYENVLLIRLT